MKLRYLNPGDHFQFTRANGPAIHKVVDPIQGVYVTVGKFVQGFPRLFCMRRGCERHQCPITGSARPDRSVHKRTIRIEGWPEGMDEHDYLDQIEEIERGLTKIRGD